MSTVQRGKTSKARQPSLLHQAIEVASRVRHSAFPRYATGRKLPGYDTQPSPASYPKLRGQATQSSSTRHRCATVLTDVQSCKDSKGFSIVRTRIYYGYPYQV